MPFSKCSKRAELFYGSYEKKTTINRLFYSIVAGAIFCSILFHKDYNLSLIFSEYTVSVYFSALFGCRKAFSQVIYLQNVLVCKRQTKKRNRKFA